MDAWPTETRTETPSQRRRHVPPVRGYPYVEQGTTNAMTLIEYKGRYEWDSLVRHEARGSILRVTTTQNLFPSTRPLPLRIPRTSIRERAEQGANFLRTYMPDVEITSEVIREQIVADEGFLETINDFDPYTGNLLASVVPHTNSSRTSAFLCFPAGELNRDLIVSPLKVSKTGVIVFRPNATPLRTFDTPIWQIVASSPHRSFQQSHDTFLAIRTYGSTFLYQISSDSFSEVSVLPTSLTGERSLIDMKLEASQASVVNDRGVIFRWNISENKIANSLNLPDELGLDAFWRLGLSEDPHSLLSSSSKTVQMIDFRSQHPTTLFDLHTRPGAKDELFVSIEDMSGDHTIHLGTTSDILWLDDRFPSRPLLGIRHGRQFDRSLSTSTVSIRGSPFTFLSSRKHALVSVYDVCRVGDRRLQLDHRPYCLIGDTKHVSSCAGQTILSLPFQGHGEVPSLYRLSTTGSMDRIGLAFEDQESVDTSPSTVVVQWSDAVNELQARAPFLRDSPGPMGLREKSQVNLREVYQALFHDHFYSLANEEASATVSDVVDKMPSFWRHASEPIDYMLTTYDIAFRTEGTSHRTSGADFLTPCSINSPSGYQSLKNGYLASQPLARDAKWHYNLATTFDRLDIDTMSDVLSSDRFSEFDLAQHPDRTSLAMRMEIEARQLLTLDLSLGSDIFSAQPFAEADTEFDTMSRATEALSLGGEPPAVEYSYFKPVIGDEGDAGNDDDSTPLGVRLLLREWVIGSNPTQYIYKDPYDESNVQSPPNRKTTEKPPDKSNAASQRPPIVAAARAAIPTIKTRTDEPMRKPLVGVGHPQAAPTIPIHGYSASQPVDSGVGMGSYSQNNAIASTQIVPGPFGGRPLAPKKPAKKRLGGF